MTNEQILTKAIEQAIERGWKPLHVLEGSRVEVQKWQGDGMVTIAFWNDAYEYDPLTWMREVEGIIYDHSFAKSLWGEETHARAHDPFEFQEGTIYPYPPWMMHLQQMVIAPDPIAYLGSTLEGSDAPDRL